MILSGSVSLEPILRQCRAERPRQHLCPRYELKPWDEETTVGLPHRGTGGRHTTVDLANQAVSPATCAAGSDGSCPTMLQEFFRLPS